MTEHNELPWGDCKVAFGVHDQNEIWKYLGIKGEWLDRVPDGWTLEETDSSYARCVAIFRVEKIPSIEDGRVIVQLIAKIDKITEQRMKRLVKREMTRDGYVQLPNGKWTRPQTENPARPDLYGSV